MRQPIETAPRDGTWVIVCGGFLCDQADADTFVGYPKDLTANRTVPVIAAWIEIPYRPGERLEGQWVVCTFDSGYGTITYAEPKWWLPMPGEE